MQERVEDVLARQNQASGYPVSVTAAWQVTFTQLDVDRPVRRGPTVRAALELYDQRRPHHNAHKAADLLTTAGETEHAAFWRYVQAHALFNRGRAETSRRPARHWRT